MRGVLVSFLCANLISKKCSKDCNVAEDTNNNDKTVDDDEAELGCTGQSKKESLVLSEYILTRLQDVGTSEIFWPQLIFYFKDLPIVPHL